MSTAAQQLARFAAELSYEKIPSEVVERTKDGIINTMTAALHGATLPWGRMAAEYAQRYGAGGPCSLLGSSGVRLHAPYAALAHGLFAHAFEQDCAYDPGNGTHPGSALLPVVMALCEETQADGRTAIAAFVAGDEVLYRVGQASHHSDESPEELGFHAPGLTGAYGAAIAAGRVLGLDAGQFTNALGIAGSLSSGLLAFTKSSQGGMVKRLHLGRAAESGVLAARLAASGYTGPETVLDGKFGYLDAYCRGADPARLTAKLGSDWGTLRLCFKRYPCHMTSQTPVQSASELAAEHRFSGKDVDRIVVEGIEKLVTHNNITEPGDLMQAQYSVPFCVALALCRDASDARSFDAAALADPEIRALCRRVEVRAYSGTGHALKSSRVTIKLKDGREFVRQADSFKGMPGNPVDRDELCRKFMQAAGSDSAAAVFDRLAKLEAEAQFPQL
jgi:2-methylcitrate dehydratase PrpD